MSLPVLSPALAKLVIGLVLALLVSLGGNAFFFYHAAKTAGLNEGEAERKVLAANVDALQQDAAVTKALSKRAVADNSALLQSLELIAERGQETRTIYRTVAAKAPLALACAPGQERMDAVNAALGPIK